MEQPKWAVTKEEIIAKIEESKKSKQLPMLVEGVFGDQDDCHGLLEGVIEDPVKGNFLKIYGCTYLFKGVPLKEITEGISLGKSMLSLIIREIVIKSWLIRYSMLFLFLFYRKNFFYYTLIYVQAILDRTMLKINPKLLIYNNPSAEFRRAAVGIVESEIKAKDPSIDKSIYAYPAAEIAKNRKIRMVVLMFKVLEFMCFLFQNDTAYRFRAQDGFENLDKEAVKKDVRKEINRILGIMLSHECDPSLVRKWKLIQKILNVLLLVSPMSKRLVTGYLLELDISKIKLDDSDFYFSLRRTGYNYRGLDFDTRQELKKEIDKKLGHMQVRPEK